MTKTVNTICRVQHDLRESRADGDDVKTNLLRTLIGDMQLARTRKGEHKGDEQDLALVKKFIKDITFTIEHSQGNVNDLEEEILLLNNYLPKQLTLKEVDDIVSRLVKVGEGTGQIQGFFKKNFTGRYDGKLVAQCINSK